MSQHLLNIPHFSDNLKQKLDTDLNQDAGFLIQSPRSCIFGFLPVIQLKLLIPVLNLTAGIWSGD